MRTWQDNMVKELNRSLSPPFLPEGFAEARVYEDSHERVLHLRIGDRDTQFGEDGNGIGSGSNVGEAVQWSIHKVKVEE